MEQLLIPVRRGGTVLIFERRQPDSGRRAEFLAIAEVGADGAIVPCGLHPLAEEQVAAAAAAAAKLPALERYSGAMAVHDLASIQGALDAPPEAGIVDNSVLMTLSLYLEFCRQSLVQEAAVRRYEARPARERLDVGLSASVYESLQRTHELERAEALIDADLQDLPDAVKRHPEAGYLLGLAASVKQRLGRAEGALALLEAVSRIRPDPKLFLRMAQLYRAEGGIDKAIATLRRSAKMAPLAYPAWHLLGHLLSQKEAYAEAADVFLKAEAEKPLEHGPTSYLAWWLVLAGKHDEAEIWAKRAEDRGSTRMESFYVHLAEIRNAEDLG
ncbi:tetratricopeptide repeat protein [Oceanibium sediminis]|uniref:tetratricopeptide repeat protein n=1 Tax=Oceanibium sediminis TaxID=2026339 RepID=UPI000DD4CA45|nr:tetratricopeptide repeat protein [Oceanibium sediminis]